jgi:L-threonylcarbamoyladenylate synthase
VTGGYTLHESRMSAKIAPIIESMISSFMISQPEIDKAVAALRAGELVGMPTETVYGLAADAGNPVALRRIFAAKGRPTDHPLIVHLADVSQLSVWAREIPEAALELAAAFWPGPLTLILKKRPEVLDLITGQQDTVGLRVPSHPVAQAVLKAFGGGVAAPSANRFGRISPTTALAVREELGGVLEIVLDGGQCDVGVESTIVDVTGDVPVILRPGMITAAQIEAVLQQMVAAEKVNAPRVSGSLESHYAPETQTVLVRSEDLQPFFEAVAESDLPRVLLCYSHFGMHPSGVEVIAMPDNAKAYAYDLYRVLRDVDKKNFRQIVIEVVPDQPEWAAVRDRLLRASS